MCKIRTGILLAAIMLFFCAPLHAVAGGAGAGSGLSGTVESGQLIHAEQTGIEDEGELPGSGDRTEQPEAEGRTEQPGQPGPEDRTEQPGQLGAESRTEQPGQFGAEGRTEQPGQFGPEGRTEQPDTESEGELPGAGSQADPPELPFPGSTEEALEPSGAFADMEDMGGIGNEGDTDGVGAGIGRKTVLPIVCAVVAAAVAVLAAVAVHGKTGRKARPDRTEEAPDGIPLKLEVYAGRCRNRSPFLRLSDCLTIGSSMDCDIIFDNPEVAARNACIRLLDGQVYIEDLDSPQGTALDGMRFRGRNKLRGGQVISIGTVEFGISFPQEE